MTLSFSVELSLAKSSFASATDLEEVVSAALSAAETNSSTLIGAIQDAGGLDRTWAGTTDASVSATSAEIARGGDPTAAPTVTPLPTAAPSPTPTTADHVSVDVSIDIDGVDPDNITAADFAAIQVSQ